MNSLPNTGSEIPTRSYGEITLPKLKAFAQASGDYNPIHQDEKVAKEMGLPGVIAHGMLSASYMGNRARAYLKEADLESRFKLNELQYRFKAMTFLGDEISVTGKVSKTSETGFTLELEAKKQDGTVVTVGSAQFLALP